MSHRSDEHDERDRGRSTEAATTSDGGAPAGTDARVRAVGRDREHQVPPRRRRLKLRLSEQEQVDVEHAARAAGLTPTGYAAEVTVAIARQMPVPLGEPLQVALADLLEARAQLRRFGTNVHLAVTALHHDGQVPEWLTGVVRDTARAVVRVDAAASAVSEAMR